MGTLSACFATPSVCTCAAEPCTALFTPAPSCKSPSKTLTLTFLASATSLLPMVVRHLSSAPLRSFGGNCAQSERPIRPCFAGFPSAGSVLIPADFATLQFTSQNCPRSLCVTFTL